MEIDFGFLELIYVFRRKTITSSNGIRKTWSKCSLREPSTRYPSPRGERLQTQRSNLSSAS